MFKYFLFVLFITTSTLSAQKLFYNNKDFNIFNNYTKLGVQLDGLAYFPAKFDNTELFSLKSQYAIGYKFGLVYNINFSNHFGFRVGVLAGQAPAIRNYFVIDKKYINTNNDYEHKNWGKFGPIFNYSVPLLLEYRNFSFERFIISLNAGVQVERTMSANITDSYKRYYYTKASNPGSIDIDLVFKAGSYFQFKPLMLQVSIVYKHRLKDQYVGSYYFKVKNEFNDSYIFQNAPNVNGKYIQRGDYIGLSFDFFFHKQAREVEMNCRTNTHSSQVKKRQREVQKAIEKARKRQEKINNKKKCKK